MRQIVYSPDSLEHIRNVKGEVIHIVDVFDERMDIFSRLL